MLAQIVLYKKLKGKSSTTYLIFSGDHLMYAKFPFYSVAQMYALSLNTPVAIMLGADHLYWVVERDNELKFAQEGCSLLSHAA